ncbi:MAG: hypothetical protein V4468_03495 [Pseudomonadota bacterium]
MKTSRAAAPADGDAAATAPPDSAGVLATDEYAGMAGVFEFDPATGKRRPISGPAFDAAAVAAQPDTQPEEQA